MIPNTGNRLLEEIIKEDLDKEKKEIIEEKSRKFQR